MENNHISIGKLIDIINRNLKQIINNELSEVNVRHGQYHFLHIISRNEGMSQKELVDNMKIDKANVTRGIIRLEENGFINRIQNKYDNRIINLFLTDKGRAFIPKLKSARRKITEICTENLSSDEREELFRLLEKVKKSTTEKIEEIKGNN